MSSPLSAIRTFLWNSSKDSSTKENEDIHPSKKQRTEQISSFITSSPQRLNTKASPSTPKKKPARNLTLDFDEYEKKDTEQENGADSSLQNFVSDHFSEDKENFLHEDLAPAKAHSKSLLNTLFSPMFNKYSNLFGLGNSNTQESTISEKTIKLIMAKEAEEDENSLNKTICYDDGLNDSSTSEETEVSESNLQVSVLGLSSTETLPDFHYSRTVVETSNNSETTYVVQQDSSFEDSEVEEEDSEEFDPFLFIATLPPIPHEFRQRPAALPEKAAVHPRLTLVLDLDETLVHCSTEPMDNPELTFPVIFNEVEYKVYVRKRPHFHHFLETVSKHFEVVVFTASQEVYASKLLDIIDPKHAHIHYRLYRPSCVNVEGNFLKDLSILGRDLSRTVIVDNSPQTFAYQLDNGIPIESWFDDPKDQELMRLLPFLFSLQDVEDVRPHVRNRFKLHEKIEHARRNKKQ